MFKAASMYACIVKLHCLEYREHKFIADLDISAIAKQIQLLTDRLCSRVRNLFDFTQVSACASSDGLLP